MIPLQRPAPDSELGQRLARAGRALGRENGGTKEARAAWGRERRIRDGVRALLTEMAAGQRRCMYCGDSMGTDIDHFQPLAVAPYRAFDWLNHLLACSHCNSNEKRHQYPCDENGCLLIDPSAEDPYDHLRLRFSTGAYRARTRKGEETIKVFGLDRWELVQGRADAFVRCQAMLERACALTEHGDGPGAERLLDALWRHPFADVLHAMLRERARPRASLVFGEDVTTALNLLAERMGVR